MPAYYNEVDPFCVDWLRNLIKAGHIADGDVDPRSIEDVRPDDLNGYDQCHFFAGIGVWSYALRQAGWEVGREVWTASLPCQSFSAIGKGGGKGDSRHLLPVFLELVNHRRPRVIFGEQVPNAIKYGWLDDLQGGLENLRYECAPCILPASAVGGPHMRNRLWWVASLKG